MGISEMKTKRGRVDDVDDDPANSILPSTKRQRQPGSDIKTPKYPHLKGIFDYPEVFLNILSFLPAQDLVQFERVDRYWKRICNDQWLWKRIYLAQYPYPTSRQQKLLQSRRPCRTSEDGPLLRSAQLAETIPTSSSTNAPSTAARISGSLSEDIITGGTPERNISPPEHHEDDLELQQFFRPRIDWKLLTKIGTNWATGTAAQYSLSPSPSPVPASLRRPQAELVTPTKVSRSTRGDLRESISLRSTATTREHAQVPSSGRHLLELSPSFIFVAYPTSPLLHVHSSDQRNIPAAQGNIDDLTAQNAPLALIPPPPGWSSPSHPDHITCIKVDSNEDTFSSGSTARGAVRLVVFYQSGGFVVLSVKTDSLPTTSASARSRVTWSRQVVYTPSDVSRRTRRSGYSRQQGDPTVVCEFHSPILVSCTERFYISVWRLPDLDAFDAHTNVVTGDAPQGPVLFQTLHSPVSFHPAALRLQLVEDNEPHPQDSDEEIYESASQKLVNPARQSYRASLAYTVPLYPERWTVAIQDIDISIPLSAADSESGSVECRECFHVGRSTNGNKTMARRWPLVPRSEIVGVKGDRAIGIGLGDKCCVLAGSDNQIQVYEIPDRNPGRDHRSEQGEDPTMFQHHSLNSSAHTASVVRREIKHVQTLLAHSSAITAIALDQGRCVSAGNDGRILVWQVDRAADVLPSDGEGGEAEPVDPADSLGGWVNVRSSRADAISATSEERSPQSKWNHVEVRTPQRHAGPHEQPSAHVEQHPNATSPLSKRTAFPSLSSSTSLHQQILPIPPVTHPLSLASAAKEYLINDPTKEANSAEARAYEAERANRVVEQLAFNDDRIVGLVRDRAPGVAGESSGGNGGKVDGVIKVWTFDA